MTETDKSIEESIKNIARVWKARGKRLRFLARRYKKRAHLSRDRDMEKVFIYQKSMKKKKRLERHYKQWLEIQELMKRLSKILNKSCPSCVNSTIQVNKESSI